MQKAQLAAALVAAFGLAAHGAAYAADSDNNGLNIKEKPAKVKLAKEDKGTTTEKGAEGACKGKDGACKGKENACKGKEGACKGKEGACKGKEHKKDKKDKKDKASSESKSGAEETK